MQRNWRPTGRAVLTTVLSGLLFGLLVVSGCSSESPDSDASQGSGSPGVDEPAAPTSTYRTVTAAPPEPGLHLSFFQLRLEEGSRWARLRIENNTPDELRVRRVGLDWPGYGRFTRPITETVAAQTTADVPFRLPRARCGATGEQRTPVAVVRLDSGTLSDPVDDMGARFAQRLWSTECDARLLHRTAAFSFAGPWQVSGRDDEARLSARVRVLRRAGDQPITWSGAQGTVLFGMQRAGTTRLAAGDRTALLPVRFSPGRCDQHGRSQVSQPFTFRLQIRVGDRVTPSSLVLMPDRRQQRTLLAFLDHACGTD